MTSKSLQSDQWDILFPNAQDSFSRDGAVRAIQTPLTRGSWRDGRVCEAILFAATDSQFLHHGYEISRILLHIQKSRATSRWATPSTVAQLDQELQAFLRPSPPWIPRGDLCIVAYTDARQDLRKQISPWGRLVQGSRKRIDPIDHTYTSLDSKCSKKEARSSINVTDIVEWSIRSRRHDRILFTTTEAWGYKAAADTGRPVFPLSKFCDSSTRLLQYPVLTLIKLLGLPGVPPSDRRLEVRRLAIHPFGHGIMCRFQLRPWCDYLMATEPYDVAAFLSSLAQGGGYIID